RGAPERARALDGVLPRLWRGAALVRGLRRRAGGYVLGVRRPHAPQLPLVRGAVLVDVRRRLRGVRREAPGAGAVGHENPSREEPLMGPFDYDRYLVDQ